MKFKILLTILFCQTIFAHNVGDIVYEPKLGGGISFAVDDDSFSVEGADLYGLETYYVLSPRVNAGWGIMYSKVEVAKVVDGKDAGGGEITKLPVYLAGKLHLGDNWIINPYLKAQAGYQFLLDTNIEGINDGAYYGLGIGVDIYNFVFETVMTTEFANGSNHDTSGAAGLFITIGYRF